MATISAQMVGDLKKKTGAGLMDCKRALVETNGDVDAAIKLLREKGLAAAAKKADRIAADGLVSVLKDGNTVAMVEVNSETDFVAIYMRYRVLYPVNNNVIAQIGEKYNAITGKVVSQVAKKISPI